MFVHRTSFSAADVASVRKEIFSVVNRSIAEDAEERKSYLAWLASKKYDQGKRGKTA